MGIRKCAVSRGSTANLHCGNRTTTALPCLSFLPPEVEIPVPPPLPPSCNANTPPQVATQDGRAGNARLYVRAHQSGTQDSYPLLTHRDLPPLMYRTLDFPVNRPVGLSRLSEGQAQGRATWKDDAGHLLLKRCLTAFARLC